MRFSKGDRAWYIKSVLLARIRMDLSGAVDVDEG
jgi:hypothetical protein